MNHRGALFGLFLQAIESFDYSLAARVLLLGFVTLRGTIESANFTSMFTMISDELFYVVCYWQRAHLFVEAALKIVLVIQNKRQILHN